MSEYIDKEDLLNSLFDDQPKDWVGYIAKYPTADVVEVVRCKDCLDYDSHDHRCKYFNHGVALNDDYCSRARERRSGI